MPTTARNPRYGRFLATGALVGLLVSVVLLIAYPAGEEDSNRTELSLLLTIFLVGVGALVGGLVAVLLQGRVAAPPSAAGNAAAATGEPVDSAGAPRRRSSDVRPGPPREGSPGRLRRLRRLDRG